MATQVRNQALVSAVEAFLQQPDVGSRLDLLRNRLPDAAQVLVAGGALRNIIIEEIHAEKLPTKDIDVFIGGLETGFPLAEILNDQEVEATDLKGLHWFPEFSAYVYDLCLVPDFIVIQACHLEPTLENLLTSIDFTVNAIAYDVGEQKLIENGCAEAIQARRIAFNTGRIPDIQLIAYRILLVGHKTGFSLAPPVFQFIREKLDLDRLIQLKRLFQAKVGKQTTNAIMDLYRHLCKYASYEDYLNDWSRLS